jgi:hypothetical protein
MIGHHVPLVAPDDYENLRFDLPWHIATLIGRNKNRGEKKNKG